MCDDHLSHLEDDVAAVASDLSPILISFVMSDRCSIASSIRRDIAFALAEEVAD